MIIFDATAFQAGVALVLCIVLSLKTMKNFPRFSKLILYIPALPIFLLSLGAPGSLVAGAAATIFIYLIYKRFSGTALSSLADLVTTRFWRTHGERSDIRDIARAFPDGEKRLYDPLTYFRPEKGFFLGVNDRKRPVYIDAKTLNSTHIQCVGQTGFGKTLIATNLLVQQIQRGGTVVAFDPKNDEFLPHVLRDAAERYNRKFVCLDLTRRDLCAWNPLAGKSAIDIKRILMAGFALSDTGNPGVDHYKSLGREVLEDFLQFAVGRPGRAIDIAHEFFMADPERKKSDLTFYNNVMQSFAVPFAMAKPDEAFSFADEIQSGTVIYVLCDQALDETKKLSKMLLLDAMDAVGNRPREGAKQTTIFLDEFKKFISRPALDALGMIRDKRANVLLGHQSLGDIRDVPADLTADAVYGAVMDNAGVKFVYRTLNMQSVEEFSKLSGSILIQDETKQISRNVALGEEHSGERSLKINEKSLIDSNMLLAMPKRHCMVLGNGVAQIIAVDHIATDTTKPVPRTGHSISHDEISASKNVAENLIAAPENEKIDPTPEDLI